MADHDNGDYIQLFKDEMIKDSTSENSDYFFEDYKKAGYFVPCMTLREVKGQN